MKGQVRIRSLDDTLEDFRKAWKAVEQGKPVRRETRTYFTSLEAARKVLTPKRLELLRVIRRQQPDSLYGLARLVDRDLKNVHGDVQVLAAHGLVSLKSARGSSGRRTTIPRVRFSEIEFRIAV